MRAAIPENERSRLDALHGFSVLDSEPEQGFDRLTRAAACLMDAPIGLISLVDTDRQFLKSCYGIDVRETSRDVAFCAHAILDPTPTVVLDASCDPRFSDNPLVTGAPGIRFYAGAPLITKDGLAIGTLCVIDSVTRDSVPAQRVAALQDLAAQVVDQLEYRNTQRALVRSVAHVGRLQAAMLAGAAQSAGNEIKLFVQPKSAAGGDFLSHHTLPGGRELILLTDISGHDLCAAYSAAYSQGIVRGLATRGADLEDIFAELNRYYLKGTKLIDGIPLSLAACAVLIDSAKSQITVRNCGCPPPVMLDASGATHAFDLEPHPPLGWFDDCIGVSKIFDVDGGFLLFWSDGLEDLALPDQLTLPKAAISLLLQPDAQTWTSAANDDILTASIALPGERRTLAEATTLWH